MSAETDMTIQLEVLHQAHDDAWQRYLAHGDRLRELTRIDPDAPVPPALMQLIETSWAELNAVQDQIEQLIHARVDKLVQDGHLAALQVYDEDEEQR